MTKSNPGNRYRKSYIGKRDANGNLDLHCTGRVDQYAIIQADKESTDINVILSRFADGDSTALSRLQAIYGDFTGLPDSYVGMINMIEDGKRAFDELPPAMKQVFDNDFVKMLASFDEQNLEKLNALKNQPVEPAGPALTAEPAETKVVGGAE